MANMYNVARWVGVGGICIVVGKEGKNFLALSLHFFPKYMSKFPNLLYLYVNLDSCPDKICSTHLSFSFLEICSSVFFLVSTVLSRIYTEKCFKNLHSQNFDMTTVAEDRPTSERIIKAQSPKGSVLNSFMR